MTPNERCETCKFSRTRRFPKAQEVISCHYNAPSWNSGAGTGLEENVFPPVQPDDWCGQYKDKPGFYQGAKIDPNIFF